MDRGDRSSSQDYPGDRAMMESLLAFKRAGCDGVLTYFALTVAKRLKAGG